MECDSNRYKRRRSAHGRDGLTSVLGPLRYEAHLTQKISIQSRNEIIGILSFVGMKSLVNWPANENHKLPDYRGSERDVFQVICDYFTNASGPLTTFSLYNLLVEAFIRAEAADLQFRQANKDPVTDNAENEGDGDGSSSGSTSTLSSRSSSVQSLVMKMASPAVRKTSTPLNQPGPHPSRYSFAFKLYSSQSILSRFD